MYHKILDEAVQELKDTDFAGVFETDTTVERKFVSDCQIDTDMEILLPANYVNSVSERLILYKELDNISTEEKLDEFAFKLKDRFGPIPKQAQELLATIQLRWLAEKFGFEKVLLKNMRFIGYFVSNQVSPFYQSETFSQVLKYVQKNSHKVKLREEKSKLSLTIRNIDTVDEAIAFLKTLSN